MRRASRPASVRALGTTAELIESGRRQPRGTYGGNAIGCAAALHHRADERSGVLQNVNDRGQQLMDSIATCSSTTRASPRCAARADGGHEFSDAARVADPEALPRRGRMILNERWDVQHLLALDAAARVNEHEIEIGLAGFAAALSNCLSQRRTRAARVCALARHPRAIERALTQRCSTSASAADVVRGAERAADDSGKVRVMDLAEQLVASPSACPRQLDRMRQRLRAPRHGASGDHRAVSSLLLRTPDCWRRANTRISACAQDVARPARDTTSRMQRALARLRPRHGDLSVHVIVCRAEGEQNRAMRTQSSSTPFARPRTSHGA